MGGAGHEIIPSIDRNCIKVVPATSACSCCDSIFKLITKEVAMPPKSKSTASQRKEKTTSERNESISPTSDSKVETKTDEKRNRDNFQENVKKHLFRSAGGMCCRCKKMTIGPGENPNASHSIGEAAHITAASKNGPRYNENLTSKQRTEAENGIWLCCNCHKIIDNDVDTYTVEKLKELKEETRKLAMKDFSPSREPIVGKLTVYKECR